jgi:hypothetical protein
MEYSKFACGRNLINEIIKQIIKREFYFFFVKPSIHIRRSDKVGDEGEYHSNDEYMRHAEEYYDVLDLRTGVKNRRRVFLATDDRNACSDLRKKLTFYV